jgi:hypothetical protein
LAVTIAHLEPPIIIQNRKNKHTFNTYAYSLTLFHLFSKKVCFAGTNPKTGGNAQNKARKCNVECVFQKCAKDHNGETHLQATSGSRHHHGRGPGPPGNQPKKDGGEWGQLGAPAPWGAPAPPPPPLGPSLLRQLHVAMHSMVSHVSIFSMPKPTMYHYKLRARLHSQDTTQEPLYLHLYLFYF